MPRLPDGWPGAVGIVVLILGIAGVQAVAPTPTAVPGDGTTFFFADPRGPDASVPLTGIRSAYGLADRALAALGESGYVERGITVVGQFATAADATTAADEIVVPDEGTVIVHGPFVIVVGLDGDEEATGHPVADTLAELGAETFVEGDRYGEGAIVLDLSCVAASEAGADAMAATLEDTGISLPAARPPWVDPPLTADERLARSTYRRWNEAFLARVQGDPLVASLGQRIAFAESDAERERLNAELVERLASLEPVALGGETHAGVMTLIENRPTGPGADAYAIWQRELSALMGTVASSGPDGDPTWFEQRHTGFFSSVEASGTRLQVGFAIFNRFALGALGTLAWLDAEGCTDVRVRLTDNDEVSGD
jgi:hypothetical protein